MEVEMNDNEIVSKFSYQNGYRLKRSSLSLVISSPERQHNVKVSHESKAGSDYDYHKDRTLIQSYFVFYLQMACGTWYNYDSLDKLYQQLGLIGKAEIISDKILSLVKEASNFTDEELGIK